MTEDEIDHAQTIEDYRALDYEQAVIFLMSEAKGRTFIWELLTRCRVFASSFSTDALTMALNEGRRDIGIKTLDDVLRQAPYAFEQMRAEYEAREARYHVMPKSQREGQDDE